MISMVISQKMNNQVATNADGEKVDQNAAQTGKPDQRPSMMHHDAADVALDRLLDAGRYLDLLDRAGRVRNRCRT